MFHTGWVRLWVMLSVLVMSAALLWSAYFVWGTETCRKFLTVSVADSAPPDKRSLAQPIEARLVSQAHCGMRVNSDLLTLEGLAKDGAVVQVAFEWLEPGGWTAESRGTIEILDGPEISAAQLIARSTQHVRESRIKYLVPVLATVAGVCVGALLLGLGVAWVRRGFRNAV